jgi:hypothetical protein
VLGRGEVEGGDVGAERAGELPTACPSLPKPMMPTRRTDPALQSLSGEYMVMPVHNSGASFASRIPSGIRTVKRPSTTIRSL